jgi:succinate dehydrogenase / fumarate reductase flavoprotein subunit
MEELCGVVRSADKLERALASITELRQIAEHLDVRPSSEGFTDLAHALDLRGSLASAQATVLGAIERRETRGCHVRSDFPELDPALQVNFHLVLRDGSLTLEPRPVPPMPDELATWLDDTEIETAGHLLE